MEIECWFFGNKNAPETSIWVEIYEKKIKRMHPRFSYKIIPEKKVSHSEPQGKPAGQALEKFFRPSDYLILLDEQGTMLHSISFAKKLEQMLSSSKHIIFCVGGAYGFDEHIKQRADFIWSFSSLTFPHQLARVLLMEQVYRGFSILNNTDYHHA